MRKRILSLLLCCVMLIGLLPTTAFAEGSAEEPLVCSCETTCTADNMNKECPVCGAKNAIPQNCGQYIPVEDRTGENGSTERADDPNGPTELSAADQVQAMIDALPGADEITDDNAEEVKEQLEAIDEAKAQLSDEEIDELDITRYMEAAAVVERLLYGVATPSNAVTLADYDGPAIVIGTDCISGYADAGGYHYIYYGTWNNSPIKWRVLDDKTNTGGDGLFLLSDALLGTGGCGDVYFDDTRPYSNTWQGSDAQSWCSSFCNTNLTTPEQGAVLPTTKSDEAFTSGKYSRQFAASKNILSDDKVFFLSAEEAENEEYGFTNDSARVVSYGTSAGVWWLRSPYADDSYYAGAVSKYGYISILYVGGDWAARPAFNLNLNSVLFTSAAVGGKADTAVDENLTAVGTGTGEWKLTLKDTNRQFFVASNKTAAVTAERGGTVEISYAASEAGSNEYVSAMLVNNSDNTVLYYGRIVNSVDGEATVRVTIPAGLTPGGSYTLKVFSEQCNGDNQTDYASDFEDISITVYNEQFSLEPGGTYYFDLSGENIPGTANSGNSYGATSLPDMSLHYVPFTYAGTVNAYKLTSAMATTEEYAQQNKYAHSLFVADYTVTHTVSWNDLNTAGLIFGKDYASSGVDYTLRAPSVGSDYTGSGDSERGTPQSNEWDAILNKNSEYILNWSKMYSWGQDGNSRVPAHSTYRGYYSARYLDYPAPTFRNAKTGFRPVLEVLNADALGSDGLKAVTLDLNGGKLGGSSSEIQIIVKKGSTFTAPVSDGLTRPDGDTGSYFMWFDDNGNSYAPGDSVPADVMELTVQWTAPTYTVTLNTNGGTINSGNVTEYTYGVGATLPTADDMAYAGHAFKGWYDNKGLTGSPVTAISDTVTGNKEYWAKWEVNQYTVTVKPENGKADITITQDYGTPITAPTLTREGYQFNGWDKAFPTTMPAENLTITAQWTVNQYTITYDLAGGTVEGNPDTYTIETEAFNLKNPTKSGYTFTGWSGTGLDGENNMTVTIPTGSTGNRTYTAHWRYNGSGHSYSYYTIKATAGVNGSISPSGNVSVREGRDQTFTITPDKGYAVANVKIDGKSIGAVKSYTFENVSRTHTIEVIFMKANGNPQTGVFVDVATGSYYEDAVDWAVENGITKGTDDTHFSPDGICTRAQAVTFLWRTAGSPASKTSTMPFTDVPVGSYYYDAVLWAVENGITKGTSDTTFSPNMTCSRAQIVAFLWRSEKSPAAGTANPFADVKSTAYYADAVLWAVKENITKGTTSTTFSPDADCTRAQIVTFLWRYKK